MSGDDNLIKKPETLLREVVEHLTQRGPSTRPDNQPNQSSSSSAVAQPRAAESFSSASQEFR